eukprot:2623023-Amphidinium_carterae.1
MSETFRACVAGGGPLSQHGTETELRRPIKGRLNYHDVRLKFSYATQKHDLTFWENNPLCSTVAAIP